MIERLVTHPERNARQSLKAVIERARHGCAAFGMDLEWARAAWDVTKHCPPPANKARSKSILYFTTHEGGTSKSLEGRMPLAEPFGSMIKAMIRLKQDGSPQTMDPHARIINAARDLDIELRHRNGDPCLLLNEDFNAAAARVMKRASGKTRYRLGTCLQEIAEFIDRHGITPTRLDWRNPIKRETNTRDRTTAQAEQARQRSLPEDEVLDALAAVWNVVEEPGDVIRMGGVTLLHCAPWRIVEELGITAACERREFKEDERGVVLDRHGQPIERYGIAYWKEKSGEPDVKWIPTVMVDTAERAISRIQEATAEPRQLARWLHEHPGRAWLPGEDLGADQLYSTADVARMFCLASASKGLAWLNSRQVPLEMTEITQSIGKHTMRKHRKVVRREDLEAALLREMPVLPEHAREAPLHERLFIVHANTFHANKATNPCLLELVTDQHMSDFLGGRGVVKSGFERLLERPDLSARTHQFRHWLNTLAQGGGVEQALIARWSGRDDIEQNGEYDHLTATEIGEAVRDMLAEGKVIGALADAHEALPPVDRADFRETVIETAHVTDIGFCLQNWNTSPCPEFGSCGDCRACAIVKGDRKAMERTEALREDNAWVAASLRAEMDEETLGASNHYKAATDMAAALDRIQAIHNDPNIPDGTIVQPNPTSPVHYGGPKFEEAA